MARTLKERVWANRNAEASAARGDTELVGIIDRIVFFNPEDGAVIAALRTGETVRGQVDDAKLETGAAYRFLGRWVNHFKYGRQFQFGTCIIHTAGDRSGTVRYLKQVAPHVGHVTAEKLWDVWGPECVAVLRETPEKIVAYGGILSEDHAHAASEALRREAGLERTRIDLWTLLEGRGFYLRLQRILISTWGAKAAANVRANPFRLLVEGMPSCGFKRTDKLYLDLGFDPHALKRQMLAAWNALAEDREGNTWMSRGIAVRAVRETAPQAPRPDDAIKLGIRAEWLAAYTDAAGKEWLTEANKARSESELAVTVRRLREWPDVLWPAAEELDPRLSPHQRAQVARILGSPVALLIGTPGTGKTFTAAAIIRAVVSRVSRDSVAVAAPTGKAAVRITAAMQQYGIDLQATTIHRLLEIGRNGHDGKGWGFIRNADNPLKQTYLIIDEASMLDTDLAANLFTACEIDTHVLLVGDPYQLPPVGHGAPLRDLIAAGVSCAELTEIQRNAGMIVRACASIKDGQPFETAPRFDPTEGLNLLHLEAETPEHAIERLRTLFVQFKASGKFHPTQDVQVVTPLNEKSQVSRVALNTLLQGWLNPPSEGDPPSKQQAFRVNDKVICLRNCWVEIRERRSGGAATEIESYGRELDEHGEPVKVFVANGEQGRALAVVPNQMIVEFADPQRLVHVPLKVIKEAPHDVGTIRDRRPFDDAVSEEKTGAGTDFALAYAITGHKSQGSEWPCVIVMIDEAGGFVAAREWTYTAISRARALCVLIGKKTVIERQCKRVTLARRKTFLVEKLKEELRP